ncbi:hypothetical protein H6A23_01445 [Olsenella uli]|uniref:CorA family divalent cation transporter n=1 Tax=Olsenella uli TaxID=133926 RepID=UPI00195C1BDE|nr:CorA family divalent cation transporter [Olsenella uli]MBM6815827.1 hypothetical protein [Olsenella uli]
MARAWHMANGHLATGEKDGRAIVVLRRLDEARARGLSHTQREVLGQLEHAAMPFLERTSTGAAGLVVSSSGRRRFGFILTASELVLIDDGDTCATALGRAVEDRARVEGPAGALCALLRELLRDHPARLSRMREDFERLEEQVLEGSERPDRRTMMADSRRMLGLDTFYQGMSDLAGELAEDDTGFVAPADQARLRSLARLLGRLAARLESLQDYSLQVHGLYQESIDLRQNGVMQWLTVVTTIVMPLTLITGWYGMNFPHMALFDAPWGYAAVIVACVTIAAVEIAFFSRRGWLSFGERHRRDGRRKD